MPRIPFFIAILTTAFAGVAVSAGPGLFKKKTDPAKVPSLIETLKSDPDEKKRKAAADELGGADVRAFPEVATVLVQALRKDSSAAVRLEAAESLGQLGQVIPLAGQALETAASSDSSPLVRLAAKRTLWDYHLNGYRSPKGADGVAMQTIEPPIASPAGPRPAVALVPVPPPPVAAKPLVPPVPPTPPRAGSLPPIAALTGPRILRSSFLADLFPNSRLVNRVPANTMVPPPILNVTHEPPVAKRAAITIPSLPEPPAYSPVPPPTITVEPPPLPAPRVYDYVPTLPPFQPELPSVVLPPDATPMPLPTPAASIPPTLPPR